MRAAAAGNSRRPDRHHGAGLPGADDRLRPVPRSQVRSRSRRSTTSACRPSSPRCCRATTCRLPRREQQQPLRRAASRVGSKPRSRSATRSTRCWPASARPRIEDALREVRARHSPGRRNARRRADSRCEQQIAFQAMQLRRAQDGTACRRARSRATRRSATKRCSSSSPSSIISSRPRCPRPWPSATPSAEAPPTHRLALGDYRKPLEASAARLSRVPRRERTARSCRRRRRSIVGPPRGAGRTGSAAPDHPLTARVMVNRIWQHHFGVGIVATPNDFGAMGEPPTHPELLDWLAVEFVDSGWSLKAMHRLMVTSATYRQSSRVDLDEPRACPGAGTRRRQPAAVARPAAAARRRGHSRRDAATGRRSADCACSARVPGPSCPTASPRKTAWKPDKPSRRTATAARSTSSPSAICVIRCWRFSICPTCTTVVPQRQRDDHGAAGPGPAERRVRARASASAGAGGCWPQHGDDATALVRAAWPRRFAPRAERATELHAAGVSLPSKRRDRSRRRSHRHALCRPPTARPGASRGVVDFCHAILNANEFLYVD